MYNDQQDRRSSILRKEVRSNIEFIISILFTSAVYILPPLINYYGQIFPIAGLIASGYASLINNGIALPPSFNIGYVVQPVSCQSPTP